MNQQLQKFEFATNVLKLAKDMKVSEETIIGAIELLHRDLCPKKEPMILNVPEVKFPPFKPLKGSWL
ncbi:hypothetical protein [Niallia sp. FSL W8-0954]|uniref:hypothetical protein n=1 Tax=Niallia sp. FSL W8-0954 TaxID=2975338 RepID=UPI0030F96D66